MNAQTSKKDQPPSPARSDESNESEGRPVREKLKETRIDAQSTSDPVPAADQAMKDAPTNGTRVDPSTSGSDSERGRLRRKRSRENFEEDEEVKHPDKKLERHVRKKSREITSPKESDVEGTASLTKSTIAPINETHGDETIHAQELAAAQRPDVQQDELPDKHVSGVASPKNKRTRDQAEAGTEAVAAPAAVSTKESAAAAKVEDERTTKRPRDAVGSGAVTETTENKVKVSTTSSCVDQQLMLFQIPAGSGFANTSSTSPFATMSPKPQTSKPSEASSNGLPQTSDKAFKTSGFGNFAKAASPFSAASSGSASPFGASNSNKLSSFASNTATSTNKPSGFASIEKKAGSSFGGFGAASTATGGKTTTPESKLFGQTPASGFGTFGGSTNTKSSLGTFGTGTAITGLGNTTDRPFGSKEGAAKSEKAEHEDGEEGSDNEDDNDGEEQNGSERRTSHPLLQSHGPPETGEENEDNVYTGRAKLYTLVGEAGKKSWQERGVGALKVNVTHDEPRKARFVLRADGTHRLLLNAALTANMRFGNPEGKEPEDGKLLFTAPTASGEVESHLLKVSVFRLYIFPFQVLIFYS